MVDRRRVTVERGQDKPFDAAIDTSAGCLRRVVFGQQTLAHARRVDQGDKDLAIAELDAMRNPPGPLEAYKAHYRGIPNSALYPFGHGLTYGKIDYAEFALGSPTLAMNGEIKVSARVTNRGTRAAEEVVQLYVHDRTASITRPVRELKAFRKLALAPGQSEIVSFTLRAVDLQFVGLANKWVVEPGMFDVWIAPSSESDGVYGAFELLA